MQQEREMLDRQHTRPAEDTRLTTLLIGCGLWTTFRSNWPRGLVTGSHFNRISYVASLFLREEPWKCLIIWFLLCCVMTVIAVLPIVSTNRTTSELTTKEPPPHNSEHLRPFSIQLTLRSSLEATSTLVRSRLESFNESKNSHQIVSSWKKKSHHNSFKFRDKQKLEEERKAITQRYHFPWPCVCEPFWAGWFTEPFFHIQRLSRFPRQSWWVHLPKCFG